MLNPETIIAEGYHIRATHIMIHLPPRIPRSLAKHKRSAFKTR